MVGDMLIPITMMRAWRERCAWKAKESSPLGDDLTTANAESFAIGMVVQSLTTIPSRADRCFAKIAMESRIVVNNIGSSKQWIIPVIADIRIHVQRT
jgi:hypothetical protein